MCTPTREALKRNLQESVPGGTLCGLLAEPGLGAKARPGLNVMCRKRPKGDADFVKAIILTQMLHLSSLLGVFASKCSEHPRQACPRRPLWHQHCAPIFWETLSSVLFFVCS